MLHLSSVEAALTVLKAEIIQQTVQEVKWYHPLEIVVPLNTGNVQIRILELPQTLLMEYYKQVFGAGM